MAGLNLPFVEPPHTFEVQADPEVGEDHDGATVVQQAGCSKQAWLFRVLGLVGLMSIGVSVWAASASPSHTDSASGLILAFNPAMPTAGHPQVKGMSAQRRTPPAMRAGSFMERTAFMPAMPQVNSGISASPPLRSAPPAMMMSSPMMPQMDQSVEMPYDPLQGPEQPQQPSDGSSYSSLGWLSILALATGGAFVAGMKGAASERCGPERAGVPTMSAAKPRPVQIIPSVLPADWAKMGEECKRLEDAGVDRIQFDVMDGNFVPNLTFGPELIAACRKYTKVPFETQLMVSQYNCETMLDDYTDATKGPNGEPGVVIAHAEGNVHLHRTLSRIREHGGSPSVALNPHTPAEMIENVLDLVDHVLVMTVNPGFGGQAYIPTMTDKIKKIRGWIVERGLDVDIEVDGGVKADWTIAACAEAGANCFIAGSGMFKYDDLSVGCAELRTIAEAAQKGQVLQPDQTIDDLKK